MIRIHPPPAAGTVTPVRRCGAACDGAEAPISTRITSPTHLSLRFELLNAERRQFDFWIGDCTVTRNGEIAGESRSELILDGCALLESWTGASGTRGSSITA